MKNLLVCTSFLLLSSMALATGLDCVKTVSYPSPDGTNPGPVFTHTYRVLVTNGQALVNAISPDSENNLSQAGDRFVVMANYSNGTYNPLRIEDYKIDIKSKSEPLLDTPKGTSQNSLEMVSSDGFTIDLVCNLNQSEN